MCRFQGGCKAPLSAIKLSFLDGVCLRIFLKTPWHSAPVFGNRRYKVKEGIIWSEAEVVAKGYGAPWNQFVMDRLSICESVLLKQQRQEIELERQQDKNV